MFRRWYQMGTLTQKHITIAPCYSTSPDRLRRRFMRLSSNRCSEEEMEVRMIVERGDEI
ncbi:Coronatine-insensitive protein 1 [Acorus calamus]|uniref:Coronatine-insensitive protein 1 n=1 Tax=Acorus calamus TaxID=4465 RepID=A0AAV9FKI3_ACOCL|nr:Coronatine-insensitive protein 1 [Acorus calamus]